MSGSRMIHPTDFAPNDMVHGIALRYWGTMTNGKNFFSSSRESLLMVYAITVRIGYNRMLLFCPSAIWSTFVRLCLLIEDQ